MRDAGNNKWVPHHAIQEPVSLSDKISYRNSYIVELQPNVDSVLVVAQIAPNDDKEYALESANSHIA